MEYMVQNDYQKIFSGEITEYKLKNHKQMLRQKKAKDVQSRVKMGNGSGIFQNENITPSSPQKESNVFS